MGERDELAIAVAPQPEIVTKTLGVPVGAGGCDDDHVAVGGEFHVTEVNGVEEFVEGEAGLVGGGSGSRSGCCGRD